MKKLFCIYSILFLAFFAKAGVDEIYQTRINALKSALELSYNPTVKQYIDEYLNNPEKLQELIGRSKFYFPLIERNLRARGLPTELKYLAATASLLNPSMVNSSGASGIWMMAYPVSKMYKLKVNSFIDERRDPLKSTLAVAQHFKDLFSIYKSWPLVIASYGCSPVMLNKCIHMSNNSLYFWDIYPHLPLLCKDLYPRVIATAYILNYYKEHGIATSEPKFETESDSILVNKWLSFQQISSVLGTSLEELRELNPSFRKDIIPYSIEGYYVNVPKSKSKNFILLKDSVYRPINLVDLEPIEKLSLSNGDSSRETNSVLKATRINKKKLVYTVKKGDNLGEIADLHDVLLVEIKKWNHLKNNNLKFGQKLVIYVEGNKIGYYRKINKMPSKQKQKLIRKD